VTNDDDEIEHLQDRNAAPRAERAEIKEQSSRVHVLSNR